MMKLSKKRMLFLYAIVLVVAVSISFALITILKKDTNLSNVQKENYTEQSNVQSEQPSSDKDDLKEPPKQDEEDGKVTENQNTVEDESQKAVETSKVTFSQAEGDINEKVDSLVENMSLREKIGQLMVVGFQSKSVDDHIKKMITNYHVGGIILYDRNMETPEQVASLTNELQQLALNTDRQIPLMLSIDQEGGKIVRMREHVTPIPSQQQLGLKGDSQLIYDTAYRTGKELTAMGIHVNFAPVLDLSDTDSRSFGTDPQKVNQFGQQVVEGLTDAGMTATLKHFPGNGRSDVDPHVETSSVQANKWDLENKDIYPFKRIIEKVNNERFFVMVTHIKYPAYDTENPASISSVIMQDLLRKQLGFKGIVVTDDLEMGAVNKYFTYEDLGYKAIQSGADLLLVCHTLENQQKVYNGILKAVETKRLKEKRIDEAVKRILLYKITSIQSTPADLNQVK